MKDKKILIIGGTGALGKTLIRRYQDMNSILIFSRDEHKHVVMQKDTQYNDNVDYKIGDVKDRDSIRNSIDDFKPDVVINTAALKHVPICENNSFESVNVNILGHQNVIEAVKRSNHKNFKNDFKILLPLLVFSNTKFSLYLPLDFFN